MNMLPDVYICPLRKKSASLPPYGTVKNTFEINKNGANTKVRILVEKAIL